MALLMNCHACNHDQAYRYVLAGRGGIFNIVECKRCGDWCSFEVWQWRPLPGRPPAFVVDDLGAPSQVS